ncbi:MAG: helix-turn-helix transcriptional regulator [Spirochaeta sp.]|jgi:transcriptional regulator with XRE-family HTH domain|nr:helix-turn-helix transcriptional regulator [Spirochaeta sp.]
MHSQIEDLKELLAFNTRSARERIGYSQQHLAEAAHISPGHMNDIEQGRKWVSAATLRNLAAALMTEPWTLLLPEEHVRLRHDHDLLMRFAATLHKNVGKTIADSWEEALHLPKDTE